jgi:hypothetical protein
MLLDPAWLPVVTPLDPAEKPPAERLVEELLPVWRARVLIYCKQTE